MRLTRQQGGWIVGYVAAALGPFLILLLPHAPPPGGLGWDFGISLGFVGATMMGLQFLLTARVRRVALPFGIDLIYHLHRYLAVVAFAVVVAHPVLLVAANPAVLLLVDPRAAPWHMTAGVVATGGFAVLLATSFWRRTLRIEYDAWRWTHAALALAAMGLAFAHIRGVGSYIGAPWQRAIWDGLATLLLVLVLYVRGLRPLLLLRRPFRVTSVTPDHGSAWTLALEPQGHRGLVFMPGQFVWLTLRHSPFAMREHPFSIASSPSPSGRLEFAIKELGDFTAMIGAVRPGEIAYVDGPYGGFSIDRHPAPGYCFIGGGIGIAPLIGMLRALAERDDRRPLWLFTANSAWDRINLRSAIDTVSRHLDLRVVHILEHPPAGWTGAIGRLDATILDRHLPPGRRELAYFVCGPTPMSDAVERALSTLDIPGRQCHSELFDLV